jgi:hypothetical protein
MLLLQGVYRCVCALALSGKFPESAFPAVRVLSSKPADEVEVEPG